MNNQLEISYENIGISSYLTVTVPSGTEVVGYQLEMITCNEIDHLLAASKRAVDGETVIYYNISSRMALKQVLERRKVTRDEFIRLAQAAVKVGREVKEYQLSEEFLVMEPEYVYVDPATCDPSFLYLPVIPPNEDGLKNFLMDMVTRGKIEMSADNFIQEILEVMNAQPFSLDKLEECLEKFKGGGTAHGGVGNGESGVYKTDIGGSGRNHSPVGGDSAGSWRGAAGADQEIGMAVENPSGMGIGNQGGAAYGNQEGLPGGYQSGGYQSGGYQSGGYQSAGYQPGISGGMRDGLSEDSEVLRGSREQGMNGRPAVPAPSSDSKASGRKKEKPQKMRKEINEKAEAAADQEDFDPEQAKKKFLLPQAAVMVALAALVSFGAFKNEAGGIAVKTVLAVVLCVAVGEIILYREIYVNGKKGNKKGKAADGGMKKGKSGKKADPPLPGQGGMAASGSNQGRQGRPKPPVRGSLANQADPPMAANRNQAPAPTPMPGNRNQAPTPAPMPGNRNQAPAPAPMPGNRNQAPAPAAMPGNRNQAYAPTPMPANPNRTPAPAPIPAPAAPMGAPSPVPVPPYVYGGMAETEVGGETELWDSSADGMEAYLEYYENGLMTRVVLDKPSTLVGRLQSQVDFAVSDPKVGKVHAEFINQDGKIYVKDLNSKNGTYLNGNIQRLNSNVLYPLNDSDRIALAKSEFVLHCSVRQG